MIDEEKSLKMLESEGIKLSTINKRAVAFAIDEILISLIFTIIFYDKIAQLSQNMAEMVAFMNSIFIYILVVKIIYQTIFISLYSQTLGKMAMKIRVVDLEYLDKPNLLESFQRAIGRVVSEALFYLGFIWANFNPLRLTWHDKFAKTIVIDD